MQPKIPSSSPIGSLEDELARCTNSIPVSTILKRRVAKLLIFRKVMSRASTPCGRAYFR